MDINRLRYFCAVADSGSVRGAADLLGLSSPALSKAIRLLEEELELKLIVQDGRNIAITDQGRHLQQEGKVLLKKIDQLRDSVTRSVSTEPELSVITFEVFSTYFLSYLRDPAWKEIPLSLHEGVPGEIEDRVARSKVRYGITYLPVPHDQIEHIKVTEIEMGVFALRSAFKGIPQNEIPFVVPILPLEGNPNRVRGLDGWPEDAYERKVLHRVTLLESALELCRQGKVAGYFPTFIVEKHNEKVAQKYRLSRISSIYKGRVCKTGVYLVKRKTDVEGKQLRLLAKAARRL